MKPQITCLLLAMAWAPLASAKVIVDQEHDVSLHSGVVNYFLDYPGDYMQQTFTVRHSGELTGVGVQVSLLTHGLGPHADPIDDLHVKVVRTDDSGFGIIDEVLAEGTIFPDSLPFDANLQPDVITDVDLSNWHAEVTEGEKLSITLSSEQTNNSGPDRGTNYLWYWNLFNPHPGGEFSIYSPQLYGPTPLRDIWLGEGEPTVDAGFRVYVDVIPEPTSALLVFTAVVASLASRSRVVST